jgi:hypothetical protein
MKSLKPEKVFNEFEKYLEKLDVEINLKGWYDENRDYFRTIK